MYSQMATLLSRGREIGYTILPYDLDTPLEEELKNSPSKRVLGYVKQDNDTGERAFYNVDGSGGWLVHFAISVLKKFPYCDESGPWIVYKGTPEKAALGFNEIVGKYAQTIHIHEWDTWHVENDTVVAVVTEWETY